MNFKFTISRKISFGFGLFILVVAVVLFITTRTLQESISLTRDINNKHAPALNHLNTLSSHLTESISLMEKWVTDQSRNDDKHKLKANELIEENIPDQLADLEKYVSDWDKTDKVIFEEIKEDTRNLFLVFSEVKRILPDWDSYYNRLNRFDAEFLVENGGEVDKISHDLSELSNGLIEKQQEIISTKTKKMEASFNTLMIELVTIFIFVLISGIVIAHFTVRSIVKPVSYLKRVLLYLGKGMFPSSKMRTTNDEIGDMAFAVNRLVDGLKRTTEFASQVGAGNFEALYEPLSEEDELGRELLKMRDDLAENERYLEQKVKERTDEVVRQKEEIENQKEKVTELYKDLTDSINYAKRLQQTILPSDELITEYFPESFVLFKPKSIVSGDFYWFRKMNQKLMISVIDCTGHGVPGAFMSLVGYNAINQAVKTTDQPAEILNGVNMLASQTLQSRDSGEVTVQDGMDMAFCTIDPETLVLEFSGAYNPLFIVRENELIELKPDKIAIGSYKEELPTFSQTSFKLQANDLIYLFSDGFPDQFGGPNGKKFMKRKFKELLLEIHTLPLHAQRKELYDKFIDWKGRESQVDDICIFGFKITSDSLGADSI